MLLNYIIKLLGVWALKLEATIKLITILASIINVRVAKTNFSFLAIY